MNRLEAEGLIRLVPRRGAYVISPDFFDIEEIYEMREVPEAGVIRNVHLDDRILSRLRAAVDCAEKYIREKDKLNYIREDASFHTILFQASANSRMRKALENMQNQMIILRHRTFELSSQNSVRQHRGILNALQREDREAAERLMVEHIRYVRERLLTYLTTQTPVVETGIRTAGEVAGQVTSPPSSSSFRRSES